MRGKLNARGVSGGNPMSTAIGEILRDDMGFAILGFSSPVEWEKMMVLKKQIFEQLRKRFTSFRKVIKRLSSAG